MENTESQIKSNLCIYINSRQQVLDNQFSLPGYICCPQFANMLATCSYDVHVSTI